MKRIITVATVLAIILMAVIAVLPFGLKIYVNGKYADVIKTDKISIVGIDCLQLHNNKITKHNINGTVYSIVVCYRNKTIEADGGNLNIALDNKTKESTPTINNRSIIARNLRVDLNKGSASASLFDTSINNNVICANKAIASFPQADVIAFQVCFDRITKNVTAYNGTISPQLEFKGYKVKEFSFTGLSKISKTDLAVGTITYDSNVATDVKANLKNGFLTVDVGYFSVSNKRIFNSPIGVKNIHISNISREDPLSSVVNITIDNNVNVSVDVENRRVSGNDTCKDWFDVVPNELKNWPISQMNVKGNFSFDIQLKPVSLKINSTCSIDGPAPQFITDLGKSFKYTAYRPDGTPFERTSGPGTNDWIPLDFVDNMATALTITEDPGFWHHKGIIPKALENSLRDDMRLGRFFRGGSTITMQLAKNLWLNRSKTLGRKLQEGILTIALESCLSKEKILELYLNVVEFGPNTYGIGPGCAKFLKKYPGEITISEALYMATRLPSPNKARSYEANKSFINKLIAIGVASGKISEEELSNEIQAQQQTASIEDEDEE